MAGLYYVVMFAMTGLFGLVAAIICSVVLVLRARRAFESGTPGRSRLISSSAIAPFIGLAWLVLSFLMHVHISNKWAHQDCGFSGDPYVTMSNGYVIGSLNTYSGYVRAPDVKTDTPFFGFGYVRSLVDVDYQDGRFTGTFDDSSALKRFVLDTRDHSVKTEDTNVRINFEQVQNAVHEDANSYWVLYNRYRHRWPKYIFLVLVTIGEASIAFVLRKLTRKVQSAQNLVTT